MLSFYLSLIMDEPSKSKFEQLYLQHRHTMLWVAQSILLDRALAEDAVHDAFLRILNHLENISLEECHKTRSFFVLIVRNIALDKWRKMRQLAETDLNEYENYLADSRSDPEQSWLDKENSQTILSALGKVSKACADVLVLHISYELSSQEIADLLDITPDTARARLHRGRKQLARNLKEDDQSDF
jgi:RNA polymerase sigma-70 factor (ECF subfamily)